MNDFFKERPIDQKTYTFRYRKPPLEKDRLPVSRLVNLPPEVDTRIAKYARKRGCSFSKAIVYLLETEEAKQMEPPIVYDWVAAAKEKERKIYEQSWKFLSNGPRRKKIKPTTTKKKCAQK